MADKRILLDSGASYLSLEFGSSKLAAGTELTASQATVAVWLVQLDILKVKLSTDN